MQVTFRQLTLAHQIQRNTRHYSHFFLFQPHHPAKRHRIVENRAQESSVAFRGLMQTHLFFRANEPERNALQLKEAADVVKSNYHKT